MQSQSRAKFPQSHLGMCVDVWCYHSDKQNFGIWWLRIRNAKLPTMSRTIKNHPTQNAWKLQMRNQRPHEVPSAGEIIARVPKDFSLCPTALRTCFCGQETLLPELGWPASRLRGERDMFILKSSSLLR